MQAAGEEYIVTRKPNLKLKTALWAKGIKQLDLALEIGLDPGRLSKIVNVYERPTPEVRRSIAGFLGLPEDELFLKVNEPFQGGNHSPQQGAA